MKELFYLNKYFVKYKWRLLFGGLFVAISNYFRILQPRIVRDALDLVVENIALYNLHNGFELQSSVFKVMGGTLVTFGIIVLILAMMMGIFMYFMRQTIIVMSRLIEYDLRNEIFVHYEKMHQAFYKKNNTGDLMARITEDVNKVRMYVGPAVMYGINLVTLFVLAIYSMLSVNVELTLYALVPLPFLSISIYVVSTMINKRSERIQEQLSTLNSLSQEVFSGIRVIKSYVQEGPMGRLFGKESEKYKEDSMSLARVNALFFPLMLLLVGASTIITIYVGGLKVIEGKITAGNIAEFVIYINMLTWPVTAIGWVASIIQRASASQKRINEFLKTKPAIINPTNEAMKLKGTVQFDNVSFTYPDTGIEALKNISFELKQGERLAILGKTGSGKTTIADLLLRLYDTSTGQILIDGQPITKWNLNALRQQIGYVPQDVFLFSDTVANNIAINERDTQQADVEKFATYAAIHQEITQLPEQYQTLVGERGVTLSGGQKQRISIARALLKHPELLLFDDCLSAVDTNTEQQITGYLQDVLGDKTTIIITHRIYSSLQFDKIIVLDEGKMVEFGNHEELIQNKGYYYELFEQQKLEEAK